MRRSGLERERRGTIARAKRDGTRGRGRGAEEETRMRRERAAAVLLLIEILRGLS